MKQSEVEQKILQFWRQDKTFQKSVEKDAPTGDFVFYDGPPFATGTPHYGHIVASLIKDMVPRYFTMRGFRVERRWGWDCHGLPIENIVEKEHGFKHKKDILAFGVDKFNEACRSRVLQYAEDWREVIDRLGRWVDFDNDYKTMDLEFMESVWWVFKELYDKGLLYEAYRSMHICPRCETTLAQSEVAQGYKDVKDLSVTAKFELVDEPGTFLLAWTTTPWTLPGNAALAIGEKIEYAKVSSDGQNYILAKECLETTFKEKSFAIIGNIKAKDLVGKKFKPLFPYYANAFKVYAADFVNTEDGTGIVHIAPAFGEDDMSLGKKEKLPFIQHVNMDGTFNFPRHPERSGAESKDLGLNPEIPRQARDDGFLESLHGLPVKHQDAPDTEDHPETEVESTDVKIIKYLAAKGLLFSKEKYTHSYPHCWRCDSPLLNYATSSWFVAVEKIKKDLLKNAEKIEWMPEHIKEGRFGQWLAGARDWSISRQRFWGSVLPIWRCDKDEKHITVIGSIAELEKLSGQKVTDLHKHFVDKIMFSCKKCGGTMRRIPDVLDCWFESGSMPFSQLHYPFENKKRFEDNFPAQFIAEGVDQTRAWFYYMHVLATALKKKAAFKHVIVNGIVLSEDGKKMSKRLQNYPDPMAIFDKYGADAVRYYLATAPVLRAEDFCFSEKGVDEVVKKVILILYNVLAFYKLYEPSMSFPRKRESSSPHVLDKWIVAKLNQLVGEVTAAYDKYDLNRATRPVAEFINELSTWYLRRSRDRFKGDDEQDKAAALATLRHVLETLSKIMAPVMPFTAEHVWMELSNKESVHLELWPKVGKVDEKILNAMQETRTLIEKIHALRAQSGIKIRQPLGEAIVKAELSEELKTLLADEINIKKVNCQLSTVNCPEGWVASTDKTVALNTTVTDELRLEGHLRELIRTINAMRKNAGLTPGDVIMLSYQTDSEELKKVFVQYGEALKKAVIASEIVERSNNGEGIEVNGEKIKIWLLTKPAR